MVAVVDGIGHHARGAARENGSRELAKGVKRGMLRMFIGLQTWIATARDREEGQALVEYALILALIAVVSIAALTALGTSVRDQLTAIGTAIAGA